MRHALRAKLLRTTPEAMPDHPAILGTLLDHEPTCEADHFLLCPACGQAIDVRQLMQVLHHEEAGHERVREDG